MDFISYPGGAILVFPEHILDERPHVECVEAALIAESDRSEEDRLVLLLADDFCECLGRLSAGLESPLPLLLAAVTSDLFGGRDNKVGPHSDGHLIVLGHGHLRV
ncbi:MAG: hypothetical protein ACK55Z_32730, partial [bacterium]